MNRPDTNGGMTRSRAVAAICGAAVLAGLAVFLARQSAIDSLAARNEFLARQLQEAQAARQDALDKAAAREAELQTVRRDSAVLARLRAEMKTAMIPQPKGGRSSPKSALPAIRLTAPARMAWRRRWLARSGCWRRAANAWFASS